jgi:hypothetical protein
MAGAKVNEFSFRMQYLFEQYILNNEALDSDLQLVQDSLVVPGVGLVFINE